MAIRIRQAPIELSTKDAAVAKDFYGENDDVLENSFISLEGAHSSALREIENGTFNFTNRHALLADMVWLFALRTEANRSMLEVTIKSALSETSRQIKAGKAKTYLKRNMETAWEQRLSELPEHQRYLLSLPQMQPHLRAQKKEFLQGAGEIFGSLVNHLLHDPGMPKLFKDSQNEGLSGHIAAGAKCPASKVPLSWTVVKSENLEFLLGDTCVFGLDQKGRPTPLVGGEKLTQVYFPISPYTALVGFYGEVLPALSVEMIRQYSIAFSTRYVFSRQSTAEMTTMAGKLIGSQATIIKAGDEKTIVSEMWRR
ncbi:DUF4238 domain-containing protein [Rhizobium sp. 32-5/1]|uniref:DUF4238 domain-containing protein n=1 Tax=Rhizobium sp. 32-5/1 TaxID=3019602 RepID=UPI00240D29C6|nr:DUF4238 domain-containing protein [Rhizobium sp. 32-5/1]WEZ84638.1 DUF4238 domain-containing protein [Rhizobium sp. 32-5/1]